MTSSTTDHALLRIAVIGATGRTGRHAVEVASARGHRVIAVARRPPTLPSPTPRVSWRTADVLDPASLADAIGDVDAIIVAIGPTAPDDNRTCGEGTRNVIAAARAAGVRRIAGVTGAMIGHPPARLGWVLRRLRASFRRSHPGAAADREAQEQALRDSGLAWTAVRPTRLVGGAATAARLSADAPISSLATSRRADVARALVTAVEGEGLGGVSVVSQPAAERGWLAQAVRDVARVT